MWQTNMDMKGKGGANNRPNAAVVNQPDFLGVPEEGPYVHASRN